SREVDDELGEGWQVRAEAFEKRFELRDHEDEQDDRYNDRHNEHRSRIEQGFLHLLLERFGLFLVRRNLVEKPFERTGLLARLYQVHEQVVEIERVLAERFMQRGAPFDIGLDIENELLHRRFVVAVAHDL